MYCPSALWEGRRGVGELINRRLATVQKVHCLWYDYDCMTSVDLRRGGFHCMGGGGGCLPLAPAERVTHLCDAMTLCGRR